jgi:hypothetical protein
MTSPFQTIDDFNGAIKGPTEGAIYTFATNPAINNIALCVAVILFIWFIVGTYSAHHSMPKVDKSLSSLSTVIVVGLLSLVAADLRQPPGEVRTAAMNRSAIAARSNQNLLKSALPLGMLGMAGMGLPGVGRRKQRKRRDRLARQTRF